MDAPRKKNLRIAIKEMVFALSRKALREEAILNLVYVLHERLIDDEKWCARFIDD